MPERLSNINNILKYNSKIYIILLIIGNHNIDTMFPLSRRFEHKIVVYDQMCLSHPSLQKCETNSIGKRTTFSFSDCTAHYGKYIHSKYLHCTLWEVFSFNICIAHYGNYSLLHLNCTVWVSIHFYI